MHMGFEVCICMYMLVLFVFRQKRAYEMRISDWSSDVCSSDLTPPPFAEIARLMAFFLPRGDQRVERASGVAEHREVDGDDLVDRAAVDVDVDLLRVRREGIEDRSSVVSGTSVSVRVDLGGRSSIKNKNNIIFLYAPYLSTILEQ